MIDEDDTIKKNANFEGSADLVGNAFPATQWSVLLQEQTGESSAGWEELARAYWQPLYVFLRKQGLDHHSAADDIQGFFVHLLSRDFLRRIERGDGLFRSFLIASLKNWRSDQYRVASAQKRGNGIPPLRLEELEAAGALLLEEISSPEEAMDRHWARAVYDKTLATLHERMKSRRREPQFLKLVGVITGQNSEKYKEIAADLGMSEGAVRQSALEMRREFGTVMRQEIRRTVAEDKQVDGEIRYLLELLRS